MISKFRVTVQTPIFSGKNKDPFDLPSPASVNPLGIIVYMWTNNKVKYLSRLSKALVSLGAWD